MTQSVGKELPECNGRNAPNDLAVNGTRDAVLELQVHFRDGVFGENRGIRNIT